MIALKEMSSVLREGIPKNSKHYNCILLQRFALIKYLLLWYPPLIHFVNRKFSLEFQQKTGLQDQLPQNSFLIAGEVFNYQPTG